MVVNLHHQPPGCSAPFCQDMPLSNLRTFWIHGKSCNRQMQLPQQNCGVLLSQIHCNILATQITAISACTILNQLQSFPPQPLPFLKHVIPSRIFTLRTATLGFLTSKTSKSFHSGFAFCPTEKTVKHAEPQMTLHYSSPNKWDPISMDQTRTTSCLNMTIPC